MMPQGAQPAVADEDLTARARLAVERLANRIVVPAAVGEAALLALRMGEEAHPPAARRA